MDSTIWYGDCCYISAVKWSDFIINYGNYLDAAYQRQEKIDDYNIVKIIS
jgi:hypothetical protein